MALDTQTTSAIGTSAGSAGGADPVTAIANAVGKVAELYQEVARVLGENLNLEKKSYLGRLSESIPIFHNYYGERIDKSKNYLIGVGALSVVFIVLIIVIAKQQNEE